MISAVVQKLRIVYALGGLTLRLLIGSGESRDGRCTGLKDISQHQNDHDTYQPELAVFHSTCWQLLFWDWLPALYLPDLQIYEHREKNNKNQ